MNNYATIIRVKKDRYNFCAIKTNYCIWYLKSDIYREIK